MVNVVKGVLVECDPAMKQYLLHLDEVLAFGKKFILQDLDDTHLFIVGDLIPQIQDKIDQLLDSNSFQVSQATN